MGCLLRGVFLPCEDPFVNIGRQGSSSLGQFAPVWVQLRWPKTLGEKLHPPLGLLGESDDGKPSHTILFNKKFIIPQVFCRPDPSQPFSALSCRAVGLNYLHCLSQPPRSPDPFLHPPPTPHFLPTLEISPPAPTNIPPPHSTQSITPKREKHFGRAKPPHRRPERGQIFPSGSTMRLNPPLKPGLGEGEGLSLPGLSQKSPPF